MSTLDDKVILLQKQVEEKKARISKSERPVWQTNLAFSETESGPVVNLHTINSAAECVRLFSGLVARKNSFDVANTELEVKESFLYRGFSYADWKSDFKTKIGTITIGAERAKLKSLEAALESLESQELKNKKTLEKIEEMLKD